MARLERELPKYDLFFLYSSRDRDRLSAIYDALRQNGFNPYLDSRDLPLGVEWKEYEELILANKPVVLLFLSETGWGPVHRQLAIELEVREFRIIPVLLGNADENAKNDARSIFRRRQYIDIANDPEGGLQKVIAEIRSGIGIGKAPSPPLPPPPSPPPPKPAPEREGEPPPDKPLLSLSIASRAVSDSSQVDLLGFSDYADALADLIKNEHTEKPITIGIEAPWGMGKTRLMRMVKDRLFMLDSKGKSTFLPTVWFDAWKYDKEESLWAALALEVMRQTRKQIGLWRRLKIWTELNIRRLDYTAIVKSAINVIVYLLLFLAVLYVSSRVLESRLGNILALQYLKDVGLLAALGGACKILYEVHKRLVIPFDEKIARYVKQPMYAERVGFIARFQDDFKHVVEVITGKPATPLVIFIDDLDRCSPLKAVEVLEAINLLLDSERCVFVIGMDVKAVAASIEAKYKEVVALTKPSDDPGGLTLGQRFLEKILQIEFRLPPPSEQHMEGYVDSILGIQSKLPVDPAARKQETMKAKEVIALEEAKGKSLTDAARSANLATVPQAVVREATVERFAESFDSYSVVRAAVKSASTLLGNNPRKVKRFVNAFRLQALIANRRKLLEEHVIDLELLAKWLVAESRWPELMGDILDEPDLLGRAGHARDRAKEYKERPSQETLERLRAATDDPRVKRLAEAEDAAPIINELQRRTGNRLNDYLHLGRIVGEAKSATAPAPVAAISAEATDTTAAGKSA